jgi:hypothetical protein
MLIRWRLPGDVPDTIEAKQAEFRAQPEITVGCLSDGVDDASRKVVADPPRRVRVLADVQGRIQGERARAHQSYHSPKRSPPHGHVLSYGLDGRPGGPPWTGPLTGKNVGFLHKQTPLR